MANEKVEIVPSVNRFKAAGMGFLYGAFGGALSGVGMALIGAPLGTAAGSLVAAAIVGGESGKAIATIGGFSAAGALFTGGKQE